MPLLVQDTLEICLSQLHGDVLLIKASTNINIPYLNLQTTRHFRFVLCYNERKWRNSIQYPVSLFIFSNELHFISQFHYFNTAFFNNHHNTRCMRCVWVWLIFQLPLGGRFLSLQSCTLSWHTAISAPHKWYLGRPKL